MRSLCVLCVLLSTAQGSDTLQHVYSRRHRNLGIKGELQTPSHLNKQTLLVLSDPPGRLQPSFSNSRIPRRQEGLRTPTTQTRTLFTAGQDPRGTDRHDVLFTRLGSDVHLPLRYNLSKEKDKCDEFNWSWSYNGSHLSPISKSRRCNITRYNFTLFSNHETSPDGHLTLTSVTRANRGIYMVSVFKEEGTRIQQNYTLHVQAPVSEPLLNVSCLLDGGADIVCRIDAGDDPWFSIMVNGSFLLENSTSSRTVGEVGEVNVTENSPGPWNITCSVRNWVSASNTSNTEVICPVPPSDPVLNLSCLHNGSLQISCSVEIGTDPIFSLSVNEKLLLEKVTKEQKRVNVTLSSPGPWDVQCSVRNHLKEKNQTKTYLACPVPPSDPVLEVSCHNGSLQISCFVEKGTNLLFSLSVNEEILLENTTNEQKRVNVTSSSPGPWDVHCSVRNHLEKKNKRERYVRCPVPLSVPIINASCQNDGTARVVCEVERGSNATYTWSVNRKHIHPSPAPNITINASEFASGAINVTCSAENSVSSEHSSTTEIFCDAPVSDPVLNASCLSNGSAVVTCWILGGTDPKFHLTVNGDVMQFPNMCSACFGLNHTISTRGPWNISCSVKNKISKLMSNISSHSCPVYMESSCLSCFQKSLIGGAVAIIVTTSPLLIAYYYIGRNTKEE